MSAPFVLAPEADIAFTGLAGTVMLSPRRLVEAFGRPLPDDGFKTSGLYSFISTAGAVLTLYDWKATSLYFEGEQDPRLAYLPSPEEFWSSSAPHEFMIGARRGDTSVPAFREWLVKGVARET